MNPNAELEKTSSSYWHDQKKNQPHSKNCESIIQKLSSPVRMAVFLKVVPKPTIVILAHATLKAVNKERKFLTFHRLMNEVFDDQLNEEAFPAWLAKKFEVRPSKFNQICFEMERK